LDAIAPWRYQNSDSKKEAHGDQDYSGEHRTKIGEQFSDMSQKTAERQRDPGEKPVPKNFRKNYMSAKAPHLFVMYTTTTRLDGW
jgi:hypothetical protein